MTKAQDLRTICRVISSPGYVKEIPMRIGLELIEYETRLNFVCPGSESERQAVHLSLLLCSL